MTTKNIIYLALGAISLLTTILFVGQFYDPEDGDRTFFIKHKPTFKQYFYSPTAYHRFHPSKLTLTEEIEESAFQEFRNDMTDNSLPILPIILMQISLTLLIVGLFSDLFKINLKYWQLLTQFVINVTITSFGLVYILWADNFSTTLIFTFGIVTVNILSVILLEKIKLNQT